MGDQQTPACCDFRQGCGTVMEVSHKRTLREIAEEIEADWLIGNIQKSTYCMKTTGQPRGFTLCIAVLGFQYGAHDGLARWLFRSFLWRGQRRSGGGVGRFLLRGIQSRGSSCFGFDGYSCPAGMPPPLPG